MDLVNSNEYCSFFSISVGNINKALKLQFTSAHNFPSLMCFHRLYSNNFCVFFSFPIIKRNRLYHKTYTNLNK